jgi:hypothetical protein
MRAGPVKDTTNMRIGQKRRRAREARRKTIGVDPKCEELARHFLSDYDNKPEDITELAEIIQDRCEGFIADVFEEGVE